MKKQEKNKAWVVTVDMGYGHLRASYPLLDIAFDKKIIVANRYQGISRKDREIWYSSRKAYEFFSRFNNIPLIGRKLFKIFDKFQSIDSFYPKRDLSKPSLQLRQTYRLIKKGWGKHLIKYLNNEDLPLITPFFIVAYFAEVHGFKNDVYLLVCDADISRAWVTMCPQKSKIKYLCPCRRVVERLKLYGVPEKNIFLTGFPLPLENTGGARLNILKRDLMERIINLDPEHHYRTKYGETIKQFLGEDVKMNAKHTHPLTLTFAVGGAGAQKKLARQILKSLKNKIQKNEINLNLVAGSRNDVYRYFHKIICDTGLSNRLDKNLNIIFAVDKVDYFKIFNEALKRTDILWTKPSELSFYTALGIPIIMAPTIGSQEEYNKYWLTKVGGGMDQEDPRYTHDWLFDWVNSGWLAEAAMSGFLDGRQFGVDNIKKVVFEGIKEPASNYQLL